jgi:hypothetical protein
VRVCARTTFDVSGLAFDKAAVALIASGQSFIVDEVASSCAQIVDVVKLVFDLAAGFGADFACCFAQQSCERVEAQASPSATMATVFAGELASFMAEALTIFSQPSMQPAPAIQRATASASATRTILIEERNLIAMLSLTKCAAGVERDLRRGSAKWISKR